MAHRIAWRVALPIRGGGPTEGRWLKPQTGDRRQVGRYATIGLGEWIRAAKTPEKLRDVMRRSFAENPRRQPRARLTRLRLPQRDYIDEP